MWNGGGVVLLLFLSDLCEDVKCICVLKPKTNFHLDNKVTKLYLFTLINDASFLFDKVILHFLININVYVYTVLSND